MRILLAAEGGSDEVVAEALIVDRLNEADVVKKTFASRGFPVVRRAVPDVIRAAYYQWYDGIVIHFDLDNTLPEGWESIEESSRWSQICDIAHQTHNSLPHIGRERALRIHLMSPCQSTESWIAWGVHGGDPEYWESHDRHVLKSQLFGDPPIGMTKKASEMVPSLIQRLHGTDNRPRTLSHFCVTLDQQAEHHAG